MKVFRDLTMFEQEILCHQIPDPFNLVYQKLEEYEVNIYQYEHLYKRELDRFDFETCNGISSDQSGHLDQLMYYVKIYVYQHTKLFLRRIRYQESCFHVKLLRQSRRFSKTIDVYPQIIVNVPNVSLTRQQLDYLSRTVPCNKFEYIESHLNFCFSNLF